MYDIAIVGSGIACSMTLCQLAQRLKHVPGGPKAVRIAVIEREGEAWNGIPYGRRSAVGALAFQKLQEFLGEPERGYYIQWLAANADSWLKIFRECGGPSAVKWISDNQPLMERNQWEELYLPRFLFGLYVSSRVTHAVERLSNLGLATVTLIHGEATEISRTSGGTQAIAVVDGTGLENVVHTARIVVAIGSPPQRSIDICGVSGREGHTHIENIYLPSEDISIQKIYGALSSLPDKNMANILILGSNASALEVLYLINYRSEIRNLINSVVVLSRSGMIPYKVCEEAVPFELTALDSLRGSFSAADLMRAITRDIRRAEKLKLNIADLRDPVGAAVGRLTSLMHISEQERFVCEHGVHFSKLMRRAGRDTRSAADELVGMGILTTLKGEFRTLEPHPTGKGLMLAAYSPEACQPDLIHPVPFSISINCGGFEELDFCSSQFINSLIKNGLCTVNSTNRGFLVNQKLEASENVYVIGPLVGGNFNDKIRYWHVESASRIAGLAKLLADSLYESLFRPGEYSLSDTRELATASMVSSTCPPYL